MWATGSNETKRRKRQDDGFTLIEALVVLTIMALLALLAPTIGRGQKDRANLEAASGVLISDLRVARQTAISTQLEYALSFNEGGYQRSADRRAATSFPSNVDVVLEQVGPPIKEPTKYAQAPTVITFLPDGTTSGGTIRLSSGKLHKLIRLSWPFGQISYE